MRYSPILGALALLGLAAPVAAQDVAMSCPPGWATSQGEASLSRCVAPGTKAVIELKAYQATGSDLAAALDVHAELVRAAGFPLQTLLRESPGVVSGVPALTREYAGTILNARFHTYLVVSRKDGVDYVLNAVFDADRAQELQPLVRDAMNSWIYPSQADTGRGWTFDQCWQEQCIPTGRDMSALYYPPENDPEKRYRWLYLYSNDPNDWCRRLCQGAAGLSMVCGREVMNETIAYWRSVCWGLAADQTALRDCFHRMTAQGAERLRARQDDPACKPTPD